MSKYKLKNGIITYTWDHFLENLSKYVLWNLKWLKFDLIFLSPYELQIILSIFLF
jgi:hypothetical protein